MIRTTLLIAGMMLTFGAATTFAAAKPAPPTKEELKKYETAKATITVKQKKNGKEEELGKIVIKFFPEIAPIHVKNFISLAESGFYNGTTFHRVIPGFMIQGGDPTGTGGGGPGYTIPAEFTNQKKHARGILSMARTPDPNSAGSQFFIVVKDSFFLDGQYTIFGEVVEGMEVADKAVNVPRNPGDKPLDPVVMTEVKVSF